MVGLVQVVDCCVMMEEYLVDKGGAGDNEAEKEEKRKRPVHI